MANILLTGTFLRIYGVGTLITGAPGIGKSELALSLLSRQHGLIADDAIDFHKTQEGLIGQNPLDHHFLFVRGLGLLDIPTLFDPSQTLTRHRLDLIIHLQKEPTPPPLQTFDGIQATKDIEECLIPHVTIPIIDKRNLEVLVETIVKRYTLKINQSWQPLDKLEALLQQQMGQAES